MTASLNFMVLLNVMENVSEDIKAQVKENYKSQKLIGSLSEGFKASIIYGIRRYIFSNTS